MIARARRRGDAGIFWRERRDGSGRCVRDDVATCPDCDAALVIDPAVDTLDPMTGARPVRALATCPECPFAHVFNPAEFGVQTI